MNIDELAVWLIVILLGICLVPVVFWLICLLGLGAGVVGFYILVGITWLLALIGKPFASVRKRPNHQTETDTPPPFGPESSHPSRPPNS